MTKNPPYPPDHDERRAFPRFPLSCTVTVCTTAGHIVAQSRTENISNGGCFLIIPSSAPVQSGQELKLHLKIPRQTRNTYMLEPLHAPARVVRLGQPERITAQEFALALQFPEPRELQLD